VFCDLPNRESRFSELTGAVDQKRDRCREIPGSRDSALRRFQSRRDHKGPAKSRIATGPTVIAWVLTGVIGVSAFGIFQGKGLATVENAIPRSPIARVEELCGSVGPQDIVGDRWRQFGVRGSGIEKGSET
jgi:hypothetical protein